jgi:hypothetical protein
MKNKSEESKGKQETREETRNSSKKKFHFVISEHDEEDQGSLKRTKGLAFIFS